MQHLQTTAPYNAPATEPLSAADFVELSTMLFERRTQQGAAPAWEFCEGFMAALVCCRRQIDAAEYLPVLLPPSAPSDTGGFASAGQQQRFMALWQRRWQAVAQALDTQVAALDEPGAYQPELCDARADHAALPEAERAALAGAHLPSFGQRWAQGFLAAVEAWPLEWAGPRNKAASEWRTSALALVQQLTQDDTAPATLSAFDDDDGPPTVSQNRMKSLADAIWAVYNMRQMWRSLGPRIETVHNAATPGRNDPCFCGSGQKYKKCCGK
jgi:uncharacterized protein